MKKRMTNAQLHEALKKMEGEERSLRLTINQILQGKIDLEDELTRRNRDIELATEAWERHLKRLEKAAIEDQQRLTREIARLNAEKDGYAEATGNMMELALDRLRVS